MQNACPNSFLNYRSILKAGLYMKIVLNGAKGRMGRIVDEAASANGHEIAILIVHGNGHAMH